MEQLVSTGSGPRRACGVLCKRLTSALPRRWQGRPSVLMFGSLWSPTGGTVKIIAPFLSLFVFSLGTSVSVPAQTLQASDIEQLKAQMSTQQRLLEKQQAQIQALESALAEQQKMLARMVQASPDGARVVEAVAHPVSHPRVEAYGVRTQANPVAPQEPQPLSPEAQEVEDELQRGPEIADATPDSPALSLGLAKIRLIGYAALTSVYRTTNSGGNVGTSFTSIP